uniref:Uncharacterized protein n=1 Tax=Micrococcus sp. V7 TaxID=404582 RepID=U5P033_9MICC|nr:hypothetical protein [Micrococcus sp. V7]AGY35525.1 hypothetical protein LMV7_p01040 [Micrococcus sp. V7]
MSANPPTPTDSDPEDFDLMGETFIAALEDARTPVILTFTLVGMVALVVSVIFIDKTAWPGIVGLAVSWLMMIHGFLNAQLRLLGAGDIRPGLAFMGASTVLSLGLWALFPAP